MVCIDNPYTDAYFNLAAEEYLLEQFPDDVFMLWQNEPSVIVGKHQDVSAEVNLDFVRAKGIKVARRHSGGGTVYHDHGNLNLTFIEHAPQPDFGKYTGLMLALLNAMGVRAYEDERHTLYIDGLKISGSAQFIRKNKVLFHATLLFSSDLNTLNATLEGLQVSPVEGRKKHFVKSVKSPVTNIREHLTQPMSITDFRQYILQTFRSDEANVGYSFREEDLAAIEQLKREKYQTDHWNYHA
jgi:lipoate-protein ligase A